jgi:hypothetical protein
MSNETKEAPTHLDPDMRTDEQLLEELARKYWDPYRHDALVTLLEHHQDRFERLEHELEELRRDLHERGITRSGPPPSSPTPTTRRPPVQATSAPARPRGEAETQKAKPMNIEDLTIPNGAKITKVVDLPPHVAALKQQLDEIRAYIEAYRQPYIDRGLYPWGPELRMLTEQIVDLWMRADQLCWPYTKWLVEIPRGEADQEDHRAGRE